MTLIRPRKGLLLFLPLLPFIILQQADSEEPHLLSGTDQHPNKHENSYYPSLDSPLPFSLSSVYFKALTLSEAGIYKNLRKHYPAPLTVSQAPLNAYLSDYEGADEVRANDSGRSGEEQTSSVSPQRTFRMVRRFVRFLQPAALDSSVLVNSSLLVNQLSNVKVQWPTAEDFQEVLRAILQIQFFYNLNLTEFVEGRIRGEEFGVQLKTEHCWDIAEYALGNKFYTLALQWLEVIKGPGEEVKVLEAKRRLAKDHNESHGKLMKTQPKYLFVRRIEKDFPPSMRDYLLEKYLRTRKIQSPRHLFVKSIALCNGHDLQETKASLKCYLNSNQSPYFKIQPLKMEPLSLDPFVALTHDFLPEKWIQILKEKARPLLRQSPSTKKRDAATDDYAQETSAYAWLRDESFQEIPVIRKMEALTGLRVAGSAASPDFQIGEYIFGGFINEHLDSVSDSSADMSLRGEVITTLLHYLNDVGEEQGGRTSFPALGLAVKPQKGSVLWWYNSDRNGNVDYRTLHGGCPLIWGEKGIASKLTHVYENMFRRACSLSESVLPIPEL